MARLLEGNVIAEPVRKKVKEAVENMAPPPHLASVLASDNPGAVFYAKSQQKACEEMGIRFSLHRLPQDASEDEIAAKIESLNRDDDVDGIMLFMPLPKGVDARRVQRRISPAKDVEGITPTNLGKLFFGDFSAAPCTAKAVITILQYTGVPLKGKEVCLLGHSEIVGKPTLVMLLASVMESPTPVCCHIATHDITFHTKRADIVIVACGKPGLVTGEMLKEGAIVIDVGINRVKIDGKTRIVGDVDFDSASKVAGMITPVPGGVGTVTTAILLENTVNLAKARRSGVG